MTVFKLKQFASNSAHAAAGAVRWNYDLAVLIAATYTPFIMQLKDSIFAMALLAGVWCVAIVGIVLKLVLPGRFDRLSVGLYLAMGWSGVMLSGRVVATLPTLALWLVV